MMIKSNAKSFLDNTAMLYKQTHHQGMMCVWIKAFECKTGENCSNILCI